MSNTLFFIGRLAAAPSLSTHDKTKVAKFTLIRNEPRGKDRPARTVSIQFTAFNQVAEYIANNSAKGDQLIVEASLENNTYTNKDDVTVYGYTFRVSSVTHGAPGPESRERLAKAQAEAEARGHSVPATTADEDAPF